MLYLLWWPGLFLTNNFKAYFQINCSKLLAALELVLQLIFTDIEIKEKRITFINIKNSEKVFA